MNYSKKITSPVGDLFIVVTDKALISIETTKTDLFKNAIKSESHKILNLVRLQLNEYFQGKRLNFDLPLDPSGTAFQKKAWKALLKIPFGKVWSYGEQAKYLKSPKASRAVGGANGKNPIVIIIPCHRVVGSTGKLTGFSSGMDMKVELLKHEGHQIDSLQLID